MTTATVPSIRLKLKYAPNACLDSDQQRVVCKFAKSTIRKGIVWWRPGLGKTRVALCLWAKLIEEQKIQIPTVCIVVARPAFEYDLRRELDLIGMKCLFSSEKNDWRVHTVKPTIFFISFASLQKLPKDADWLIKFIIVDELYLFSNPKTNRSILLRDVVGSKRCIGLSGTILPAIDNFAIWGQAMAVGVERRIAKSATQFRSKYQTSFDADFGNGSCRLFRNKPGYQKQIFTSLSECADILFPPTLTRSIVKENLIELTGSQRAYIKSLQENFYLDIDGKEQYFKFVLQTMQKIRGILNGWIETEDGIIKTVASNKVQYLLSELEELDTCNEQCLVWCAFRNDIKHLTNLSKDRFASLQMTGGQPFNIEAWKQKKANIVFATMGSGSTVNHFSQVPYAKFFSLSYKPLDLQQSSFRNNRKDTVNTKIFYEFLMCRQSLDQDIYRHLNKGIETEQEFIQSWAKSFIKLSH